MIFILGSSTLPRTQGRSGEVEGRTGQANQVSHAQQQQQQQQQTQQTQQVQQQQQQNQQTQAQQQNQQQQLQQQQQMHQQNQQQPVSTIYDSLSSKRGMDSYNAIRSSRGGPPSHHASQASLHHKSSTLSRKDESANGRAPSAAAADNRSLRGSRRELSSKSVDYSDMDAVRDSDTLRRRNRSKSTDDVSKGDVEISSLPILDSSTLKRMLKPISSRESESRSNMFFDEKVNSSLYTRQPRKVILPMQSDYNMNEYGFDNYEMQDEVFLKGNRGFLGRGGRSSYSEGMKMHYNRDITNQRTGPLRSVSLNESAHLRQAQKGYHPQSDATDSPPSELRIFDVGCYATTPSSSMRFKLLSQKKF